MSDVQKRRSADKLKTKIAPAIRKAKPVNWEQQNLNFDQFEKQHVHDIYDNISDHFSSTRQVPWPLIQKFVQQQPKDSAVLDNGCGNGKYLKCMCDLNCVGLDYSPNLASIAYTHQPTVVGDSLNLPFKADMFDCIISIAVIHHFMSEDRRLQSLTEMHRVLKRGGKALICVWAFEQELKQQDNFIPWSQQVDNKQHFSQNQQEDQMQIVSNQKCIIQNRYYHFFKKCELSQLCKQAGFEIDRDGGLYLHSQIYSDSQLDDEYFDHDNWYVLLTKT